MTKLHRVCRSQLGAANRSRLGVLGCPGETYGEIWFQDIVARGWYGNSSELTNANWDEDFAAWNAVYEEYFPTTYCPVLVDIPEGDQGPFPGPPLGVGYEDDLDFRGTIPGIKVLHTGRPVSPAEVTAAYELMLNGNSRPPDRLDLVAVGADTNLLDYPPALGGDGTAHTNDRLYELKDEIEAAYPDVLVQVLPAANGRYLYSMASTWGFLLANGYK